MYPPPCRILTKAKNCILFAALTAAVFLPISLTSCKMNMDDSAGGGRLAFYIDRATAYNLNSAGGRIIDGDGARRV